MWITAWSFCGQWDLKSMSWASATGTFLFFCASVCLTNPSGLDAPGSVLVFIPGCYGKSQIIWLSWYFYGSNQTLLFFLWFVHVYVQSFFDDIKKYLCLISSVCLVLKIWPENWHSLCQKCGHEINLSINKTLIGNHDDIKKNLFTDL